MSLATNAHREYRSDARFASKFDSPSRETSALAHIVRPRDRGSVLASFRYSYAVIPCLEDEFSLFFLNRNIDSRCLPVARDID